MDSRPVACAGMLAKRVGVYSIATFLRRLLYETGVLLQSFDRLSMHWHVLIPTIAERSSYQVESCCLNTLCVMLGFGC